MRIGREWLERYVALSQTLLKVIEFYSKLSTDSSKFLVLGRLQEKDLIWNTSCQKVVFWKGDYSKLFL